MNFLPLTLTSPQSYEMKVEEAINAGEKNPMFLEICRLYKSGLEYFKLRSLFSSISSYQEYENP